MAKNALPDELTLEEVQAMAAQGHVSAPELPDELTPEQAMSMGGQAAGLTGRETFETGLRSAMEGLTLGLSEPVASGSNAAESVIMEAIAKGSIDPLTFANITKAYEADVSRRRQLKERAPGLDIAGQVVGGIAPMIATGGASTAAQLGVRGAATAGKMARALDVGGTVAAKAAGMAARPIEMAAASLPKTAIGGLARGGAEIGASAVKGATGAVSQEAIRQTVLENTGFLKEGEAPGLDEVATLGGVLGGGLGVAGKALSASKVMGKVAAGSLLGVKPKVMDEFVENYERIKTAPSLTEVQEAAKANVKKIKELAKTSELNLSQDVTDQLEALKDRVGKSSAEAFEVLESSNRAFPTKDAIKVLSEEQQRLLVGGRSSPEPGWVNGTVNWYDPNTGRGSILGDDGSMYRIQDFSKIESGSVAPQSKVAFKLSLSSKNPIIESVAKSAPMVQSTSGKLIGDESKIAFGYLDRLKSDLVSLGDEISAPDMKRIIQRLDADYTPLAAGEFSQGQSAKAINSVRRGMDQLVKTRIPEYATKMKEVASLADLHARVFKEFGKSDQKALAGVRKALAEKNPLTTGLLDEFAKAQPVALEQARAAKVASDSINSLSEDNIGNRVLAFMQGRGNQEAQDLLMKLGAMSSDDLVQNLNAARINSQFDKEFLRGSRNVNLWTMMMGLGGQAVKSGLGYAVGGAFNPMLGVIGATMGATVDHYGPAIARQMLTAAAKIKGIPTVAKIRALSLPENIKDIMLQDFIRAMRPVINQDKLNTANDMTSFFVPEDGKNGIKQEIIEARGLSPEDRAEMLIELEKEGKVSGFDRVMFARADKQTNSPIPKIEKKKPVAAELATQYYKFKKEEKY